MRPCSATRDTGDRQDCGGGAGGSGRAHSQAATQAMQAIGSAVIHQRCAANSGITTSSTSAHTAIIAVAIHLPRRATAP